MFEQLAAIKERINSRSKAYGVPYVSSSDVLAAITWLIRCELYNITLPGELHSHVAHMMSCSFWPGLAVLQMQHMFLHHSQLSSWGDSAADKLKEHAWMPMPVI